MIIDEMDEMRHIISKNEKDGYWSRGHFSVDRQIFGYKRLKKAENRLFLVL